MAIEYDGMGDITHPLRYFRTVYSGAKRTDEARANGQGGLYRQGYYWRKTEGEHLPLNGPYKTRIDAEIAGLRAVKCDCADALVAVE
jgi:hypothetical protein